ncbi:MAG: UbiA family prenyltransferase [Burkholderiaceae bacterium]
MEMTAGRVDGQPVPARSRPLARLAADDRDVPLFVDLDGTLIRSNLLWESFAAALRANPLRAVQALLSLLWGRAALKRALALVGPVDPAALPYRRRFVHWLKGQHQQGRRLVLATAADQPLAESVAMHLGLFEAVLASDGTHNNKGRSKLDGILAYAGGRPFDYCGDSLGDLPIFERARRAILVGAGHAVLKASEALPQIELRFASRRLRYGLYNWLAAIRPFHWLKNLLVLVPIFTAFLVTDQAALVKTLLAVIAMCLAASAGYLVNDLLDMQVDRRHPRKRRRPFAAGRLTAAEGFGGAALLLVLALALCLMINVAVFGWVVLYLLGTFAYSVFFKREPIADVFVLAGLHTIRIIVGAEAVDAPVSFWLLAFSVFFFFGLAIMKRCGELVLKRERDEETGSGRSYSVADLAVMQPLGIASGIAAVLVLALYVQSPYVADRYPMPELLWLALVALLVWLSRAWLDTGRGLMHDDPLIYAMRNPAGRLLLLAVAASFGLASLWGLTVAI